MVRVLATTVSILSQKGSNFLSPRRITSCFSRYPVLPLNSNRAMLSCMGKSASTRGSGEDLAGATLTCCGERQKLS